MSFKDKANGILKILLKDVSNIPVLGRFFEFLGGGILLVLGIIFILALASTVYEKIDRAGWVTHGHNTSVWMQGDWLIGEYRNCEMLTTSTKYKGNNYTPHELATNPHLFCGVTDRGLNEFFTNFSSIRDDFSGNYASDEMWNELHQYFHILSAHYWGRIDRKDRSLIFWRCQRDSNSLTCWALSDATVQPNHNIAAANTGDFGHQFGWYVDGINHRMATSWSKWSVDPHTPRGARAFIVFIIHRDGSPTNIQMDRSSGSPTLDDSCLRGAQRVGNFGILPQNYSPDILKVSYYCEY